MGTAPQSKPRVPSQPFGKHQNRRSCIADSFLLKQQPKHSTLIQLIMLQDWQRVLIRASLFPKETSKSTILLLYDVHWKVFPLHLACTLQPPDAVIAVLLKYFPEAATIPVERYYPRKRISRWVPSLPSRSTASSASSISTVQKQREPLFRKDARSVDNDDDNYIVDKGDDPSIDSHSIDDSTVIESPMKRLRPSMHGYPKGSFISLEDSIGDEMTESGQSITNSSMTGEVQPATKTLGKFLTDQGMVLQLTSWGGVLPMTVESNETQSTESSDENNQIVWDWRPLHEAADWNLLWPVHLGCLYQASAKVVDLLIEAYAIGGLSAVMGMLPLHIVAAGWTLDPLFPKPPSPIETVDYSVVQILTVLVESLPQTVHAKSGNHCLTAIEYVEQTMEEGKVKDECLEYLRYSMTKKDEEDNYSHQSIPSLFVDSSSTSLGSIIPSEIHCLDQVPSSSILSPKTITSPSQSVLYTFLLEKDWQKALEVVEKDPKQAKEWHYGIDNSCDPLLVDGQAEMEPLLWKRLCLHLSCALSAPVGLVHSLIQAYPDALLLPDPHNGSLPLHLASQFGASYSVIRALIQSEPSATQIADIRGRIPLHYAVLAVAPTVVLELFVGKDCSGLSFMDDEGNTPLDYARQMYPVGSPAIGFLDMAWE